MSLVLHRVDISAEEEADYRGKREGETKEGREGGRGSEG